MEPEPACQRIQLDPARGFAMCKSAAKSLIITALQRKRMLLLKIR